MKTFATFQKFSSTEEAEELVQLLQDNNIEYEIVDNSFSVDLTFGSNRQTEKEVKVQQTDFPKVNQLLEKIAEKNIFPLNKDHYLQEFADDELLEIIQKPDEWSKEDYLIAIVLLKSKGKYFTQQQLDEFKQQRLQQLAKPESGNTFWTVLGYLFSLLGGLLGVFIGWHLMTFKKTLPNGQKVYTYTKQARSHGQIIFGLGLLCMVGWIIYKLS
jgi:hypothetical protein